MAERQQGQRIEPRGNVIGTKKYSRRCGSTSMVNQLIPTMRRMQQMRDSDSPWNVNDVS
jgi:hypothetical protein